MNLRVVPAAEPVEGELIRSACQGDTQAFAALYRNHSRYIAGVVFRLLGADREVDDVVQDTFLAAYRGLAQLTETAAFRRWLVTIAVRQVQAKIRSRVRARDLGTELALAVSAEEGISRHPDAHVLYDALDGIDVRYRVPWLLLHLEGHSLPEVSVECGISVSTAKRRIAQAEEKLRTRLGHG